MAIPQAGIFVEGTNHHHFLEYSIEPGAAIDPVRAALADLADGDPSADRRPPNLVVGFGPALWSRLAPAVQPEGFHAFAPLAGPAGLTAPATQRDVLVWLHGTRPDDTFDGAMAVHRRLAPVARLDLDLKGFAYRDSRDLTGFVDGTANPKGEAALAAALLGGDAVGAGGAFVLTQRWVHALDDFLSLTVGEQERVIGRTKADSVELEPAAMPADAHVARTDIAVDGVPQTIYRRSAPYGSVTEHGLYFLAFACDLARFDAQLASMFGLGGDGMTDRLTRYSRPVTGAYWFAPSVEALRLLAKSTLKTGP